MLNYVAPPTRALGANLRMVHYYQCSQPEHVLEWRVVKLRLRRKQGEAEAGWPAAGEQSGVKCGSHNHMPEVLGQLRRLLGTIRT